MELNKIEKFLERYEEGETSLAEENMLREFFLKGEVPPHLRSYQLIFMYSHREKSSRPDKPTQVGKRNYRFVWSSIAAILVVALGLFFSNDPGQNLNQNDLGTITDEELALQKTKETLEMVSQIMNEGKADLVYLKEFNNTKNKIIQLD